MNFKKRTKIDWPEPLTLVCLTLLAAYAIWGVAR